MPKLIYKTTPFRAASALLVGALVGSATVIVGVLGPMAFLKSDAGGLIGGPWQRGIMLLTWVGGISLVAFGIGLTVLAIPAWWALHRAGRRNWSHALILGVCLSLAVCIVLSLVQFVGPGSDIAYSAWDSGGATVIDGKLTAHGWAERVKGAAWVTIAGAFAALTVWRVAYRGPRLED